MFYIYLGEISYCAFDFCFFLFLPPKLSYVSSVNTKKSNRIRHSEGRRRRREKLLRVVVAMVIFETRAVSNAKREKRWECRVGGRNQERERDV
jgi:hypothetical protein